MIESYNFKILLSYNLTVLAPIAAGILFWMRHEDKKDKGVKRDTSSQKANWRSK
jgi:C4-dicarboxylate transporter